MSTPNLNDETPENFLRNIGVRTQIRAQTIHVPTGEAGVELPLELRALAMQLRWGNGGILWQTPLDLRYVTNGVHQRKWLVDQTRLLIWGISIAMALIIWMLGRK